MQGKNRQCGLTMRTALPVFAAFIISLSSCTVYLHQKRAYHRIFLHDDDSSPEHSVLKDQTQEKPRLYPRFLNYRHKS